MPQPVRGFADLHSHPMAHLGIGGKVIAGAPWHERGVHEALKNCQGPGCAHNLTSYRGALLAAFIRGMSEDHGPCGAPTFEHWPTHRTMYHQQMYVDWLRRAHAHGLRLLCAVAVNNELLARQCGAVRYSDYNMLESQVRGLRAFVDFVRQESQAVGRPEWLGIADTPAAARGLIGNGQLAIVIGVEMDTIESLARHTGNDEPTHLPPGPSLPTRSLRNQPFAVAEVSAALDALQRLGVTMVTPVHLADNSLGGAAIYDDRFDILNCWIRGHYFAAEPNADVAFQLGKMPALFAAMRHLVGLHNRTYAGLTGPEGHANSKGLTPVGDAFIREAMRRGMVLDVDHMSSKMLDGVLAIAAQSHYPVVSSHSSFRDLGYWRHEADGGLRHEAMKTAQQVDAILSLGGLVAPLTNQHKCKSHGGGVPNDADGTSLPFAQAFLYAVDAVRRSGKGGVGLGSDFNGAAQQPGPRYRQGSGQPPGLRVLYDGEPGARAAFFTGLPLPRDFLPGRARPFDINVDGLAHYGLLADFVEELRTVQVPDAAIDTLFDSAEAFLQLWERCRAFAGLP